MPPKKTVAAEQKPKKKPAMPFVQPENNFDETNDAHDDAPAAHAAPKKGQKKHTHERTPLNHATETIDGMEFKRSRGILDGSSKKTLDIDPTVLNPELSYYWTNDEKGLVDQRIELGYQTVPQLLSRTGEKISTRRRVGTQKDGTPLYAVLMATPKTWKKERQDAQEAQRKKLEGALVSGSTDGKEELGDKFYTKEMTVIE